MVSVAGLFSILPLEMNEASEDWLTCGALMGCHDSSIRVGEESKLPAGRPLIPTEAADEQMERETAGRPHPITENHTLDPGHSLSPELCSLSRWQDRAKQLELLASGRQN